MITSHATHSKSSIIAFVAGVLLVSVPLCGYLFSCGCDWPWHGSALHCNYFTNLNPPPCPFCVRAAISIPLLSAFAMLGLLASRTRLFRKRPVLGPASVFGDALIGLLVFVGLTTLASRFF